MRQIIMAGLAASLMAFPLRSAQPDAYDDDYEAWVREQRYNEAKLKQARDITQMKMNNLMLDGLKRPEGGYIHTSKKLSKRAKRRNRGKR